MASPSPVQTPVTVAQLTSFYAGLLAYEYRGAARANAFIQLLSSQGVMDLLPIQIQNAYTINTAVGAQLDVIGRYVGAPRDVYTVIDRPFFGYWDSTITNPVLQNTNGYTDSTNPAINAQSIYYDSQNVGLSKTQLTDDQYRLIIAMQIFLNTTDGSFSQIVAFLYSYLNGVVSVEDNQDMTMTYTVSGQTPVPVSILTPYLPQPMGVAISVVSFTASASPSSVSKTQHSNAPVTVTTSSVTVTPTNGTGPFTYNWQRLTESRPDFPDAPGTSATAPTSATTAFVHNFGGSGHPFTSVSTWQCVVTDAHGLVYIIPLTVTINIDGPP